MNESTSMAKTSPAFRVMLTLGAVAALFCAAGAVADIVIGMVTGAELSALPSTATEKLAELSATPVLGLYRLDLLNMISTLALIPSLYACWLVLRGSAPSAGLALIFAITGAAVFVANNAALPMLGLSSGWVSADEQRRAVLAAAGEALLAKGAHGSPGVLPGFLLSTLASLLMSGAMLASKVFSRLTAVLGLCANLLLGIYLLAVTFVPDVRSLAMMVAAPGGLMAIAWMTLTSLRLFNLARKSD